MHRWPEQSTLRTAREWTYAPNMAAVDTGMSLGQALEHHMRSNGFTRSAYREPYNRVAYGPLTLWVPNPPRRQRALPMHDLHHVLTGYGTDLIGEWEISAWELRRGLRPLGLYVSSIVISSVLLGVLFAPRRVWAAYRSSGSVSSSLFHQPPLAYEELLNVPLRDARLRLGIPEQGLAQSPPGRHRAAP